MGHAHEVVASGRRQQHSQVFIVVLVGAHVVGIAAVAPHGQAVELAHEMVLQPRSDELAAVIEVFRADEADHGVDQKRRVMARKAIAARFHSQLIPAVMRVGGQFAPLPRLKIELVGAVGGPLARHQVLCLGDQLRADAKGRVALFRSCDALEHQIAGRAVFDGLHLRGHMRQHADLGGNLIAALELVEAGQNGLHAGGGGVHGVEADHRVAHAKGQALQHACRDALHIIDGMVGLEPGRKGARLADGGDAGGLHAHAGSGVDQVQIGHQLAYRGDDLAGQAATHARQLLRRRGENLFPKLTDGHVLMRPVDGQVQAVQNQPGHLVLLIGHGGVLADFLHRHFAQHDARSHALLRRLCRHAAKLVA